MTTPTPDVKYQFKTNFVDPDRDKFQIRKMPVWPAFPWLLIYPEGFSDLTGMACTSFDAAVAEFTKAAESQCPGCGKGTVVDTDWGWRCTSCEQYDVAVGCVGP